MLNGADGIAQLEEEARKLGVTMSTEDAAAAEEFGDKMAALQTAIDALAIKAGSVLVPALTQVVEKLTEVASGMGKLKKDADEAADGMGTVWMNVGNTLERWSKTVGDVFHDARAEFAATSEKLDNMLKNQADLNDEVDRQANAEIAARAAERAALEKEHERQHDQAILDLAKQQADEKERAAQAARDKAAADKAAAAAAAEEAAFLEMGLAAAAGAGTGAVAAQEAELDELVDDALDPFGSFAQELMMQAGGPPAPTELAAMAAPVATAAGTFAAAGAAGLGVSTAQERAADAAESTAEYTRQLVEMGRNGPFVFQA
jgi:colicin import membrane protein